MKTNGLSPKAALAFLTPIAAALAVAAADKLLLGDSIPDGVWLGLLAAGPLAGAGAAAAKPGVIVDAGHEELDLHDAPGA
jgi:hypothetical protein